MMKTGTAVAAVLTLVLLLAGCTGATGGSSTSTETTTGGNSEQSQETTQVMTSNDKHVFYIRNYVGMNCANVGYTAMNELRYDDYGNGRRVQLVFVTPDGTHLDLMDEDVEMLQQYKVSAQSIAPNTEVSCTFETDSDGEEYENLVRVMGVTQIVLAVDKVGENGNTTCMTEITQSPDQYSCYVRDYTGRNLMDCGYISLAGNLTDDYGCGCYIKLSIMTDDGSYVDLNDHASLSQFYVTGQDIAPNTEIELTPSTDSSGEEYSNILDYQSIESITLYVSRLP